jgi:disulfide bond formation protein DsbB
METIPFFEFTNTLIMSGVLALQIFSAALLLGLLGVPFLTKLVDYVGRHALVISFIALIAGLVGSLYYSSVANFPACVLCWAQRVFIYPQAIIFGLALLFKRRDVLLYTVTLSAIGFVIALYNIYVETFAVASAICEPNSVLSSCTEKYVEGFGYITIPVMSGTLLAALLLVAWAGVSTRNFPLSK